MHLVARSLRPALLTSVLASSASALPMYEILPLGFTDAEHTRSDGEWNGNASLLSDSGYVAGTSTRYVSTDLGSRGQSAWFQDLNDGITTRIGFVDATHTRSDGTRLSFVSDLSGSGYVLGLSTRYSGSAYRGESVWFYDANDGTTTRLGLFDADHTSSNGMQLSQTTGLSESGYAAGSSRIYRGGASQLGSSGWFFDPSDDSITRIGLFDAAHTASYGGQNTHIVQFSDAGYAVGTSSIYNGTNGQVGTAAWIYDAGDRTNTPLGFYDAVHTSSAGSRNHQVQEVTDSGYAIGTSRRYNLTSPFGSSAWLYDANDKTTTRLGFLDAAHTGSNGIQDSGVTDVSESGYVVGTSSRFGFPGGSSGWIYSASDDTTTRIGYFDAVHTRNNGLQVTSTTAVTESGLAAGRSQRFAGGATLLGFSAWLYDSRDASTTRLGLIDALHTGAAGEQSSSVSLLTDSGYAVGSSNRYGGPGLSMWLYDPNDDASTMIGLLDATHTRNDGQQNTDVTHLTESGYAAGDSDRYNGGPTAMGQSAWLYDASTDSLEGVVLSQRSDGYAFSSVSFLDEEGLALGSYRLFGAGDVDLGTRAFAWTPDGGVQELGDLVADGLTAEGWQFLRDAIRANGLGMILGRGRVQNGGDIAYLLTPVPVPEPGTGLLVTAGLVGLALRRRRVTRSEPPADLL